MDQDKYISTAFGGSPDSESVVEVRGDEKGQSSVGAQSDGERAAGPRSRRLLPVEISFANEGIGWKIAR